MLQHVVCKGGIPLNIYFIYHLGTDIIRVIDSYHVIMRYSIIRFTEFTKAPFLLMNTFVHVAIESVSLSENSS